MTYIDRDLGPDGPTRAPAKPVTTQRTPAGGQAPLLDLQRLAGNAAVNQAMRSGRFDSSLPVQRVEAEDEEKESEGYENEAEMADEAEKQAEEAEDAEAYGEAPEEEKEEESEEG